MGHLDDYLHLIGGLDWYKWHFDEQRQPSYQLADTMAYGHDAMSYDPATVTISNLSLTRHGYVDKTRPNPPSGLTVSAKGK
jgi:hypothetical protein